MLAYLSARAKTISLIAGFLFSGIGSAWSYVVVQRASEELRQLSDTQSDLRRQIDSLNSNASNYFIANQQGDLIFILAVQASARLDIAGLVYKGNMLDRATPVRNMIGALAIAKQLDYRQTYDAYEKLNDETRANLSYDNFSKLKEMERAIISKGQERVPLLLNGVFQIESAINTNKAAQKKSQVLGLIASTLGGLILLCVNLIGDRRSK